MDLKAILQGTKKTEVATSKSFLTFQLYLQNKRKRKAYMAKE